MTRRRKYKLVKGRVTFHGWVSTYKAPKVYHKKPSYCRYDKSRNITVCYYD